MPVQRSSGTTGARCRRRRALRLSGSSQAAFGSSSAAWGVGAASRIAVIPAVVQDDQGELVQFARHAGQDDAAGVRRRGAGCTVIAVVDEQLRGHVGEQVLHGDAVPQLRPTIARAASTGRSTVSQVAVTHTRHRMGLAAALVARSPRAAPLRQAASPPRAIGETVARGLRPDRARVLDRRRDNHRPHPPAALVTGGFASTCPPTWTGHAPTTAC